MKLGDPRYSQVTTLIDQLFYEAARIDKKSTDVYAQAQVIGTMKYLVRLLFLSLKDGDYLEDSVPAIMARVLDEIGQQEVMAKLNS